MARAWISWRDDDFVGAEREFHASAEFCSENSIWRLNAGHVLFMQGDKYNEAAAFYEPIVRQHSDDVRLKHSSYSHRYLLFECPVLKVNKGVIPIAKRCLKYGNILVREIFVKVAGNPISYRIWASINLSREQNPSHKSTGYLTVGTADFTISDSTQF